MASRPAISRGTIETNIARWPMRIGASDDADAPLTARTLLGSFSATHQIGLLDLKVLAFAIERWRDAGGQTASDSANFTLYQLGQAIYGREPDGEERRLLREAIDRLYRIEITAYGEDARTKDRARRRIARDGRLFAEKETVWDEQPDDAPNLREIAGRRASSFRVWLGPWLVEQIRAGNVTYLDFATMRDLSGLALRLWVFLQAEPFVIDDRRRVEFLAATIELGPELDATLGLNFARPVDARKALRRAAERVAAVDGRYRSIGVTKDGGSWILEAERTTAAPRQEVLTPA